MIGPEDLIDPIVPTTEPVPRIIEIDLSQFMAPKETDHIVDPNKKVDR